MVKQIHNDATSQSARTAGPPTETTPDDAFMRLFDVVSVLGGAMERGLAERGLTRARAWLIWQLHHEGPMTQRALSEILRVTPRNVTGLVDALEAGGFIARTPHPTDRRATLVTLTAKGVDTANHLTDDFRAGATYLFKGTSARDLEAFVKTIERVLDRL